MAGITHLSEIYNKKGREFLDSLFNQKLTVTEKPDGCLSFDTIIETEDGPMTIQEVCETQYIGKIKTFCIESNKIVWDNITAHLIKEDSTKDWYELETVCGKKITVTGNHKIYCENLDVWKRVDELDGTETIIVID